MLTEFLVPETVAHQNGESAVLDIGAAQGKTVLLTLGITRIVEQESIDVSIQGSPDKTTWTPILAFPQKFYCGTYAMVLDLTGHPDVQFLKANWKLDRWGRGDGKPMFEFYLHAKQVEVRMMAAT
jgi:hypothetical protein